MIRLHRFLFQKPEGIHNTIRLWDELGIINIERSRRESTTVKPDVAGLLYQFNKIINFKRVPVTLHSVLEPLFFSIVLPIDFDLLGTFFCKNPHRP